MEQKILLITDLYINESNLMIPAVFYAGCVLAVVFLFLRVAVAYSNDHLFHKNKGKMSLLISLKRIKFLQYDDIVLLKDNYNEIE